MLAWRTHTSRKPPCTRHHRAATRSAGQGLQFDDQADGDWALVPARSVARRMGPLATPWGTPGELITGQQGAPAVCLGHLDPAIYLEKCLMPVTPSGLVFLTRKKSRVQAAVRVARHARVCQPSPGPPFVDGGQASCASLRDRGPRDAAPTTSPRDPRTAPAAESAAVLPAGGVEGSPLRDLLTGEQPRRGAKRGPLAPVTGPAQQIKRPPTSSRYSTRRRRLANTTAAASLHRGESDVTAKLTANPSDSHRSVATSADEHEPSTCVDGRPRTGGEELEVRPSLPRGGPASGPQTMRKRPVNTGQQR